jgi:hypothetical protein
VLGLNALAKYHVLGLIIAFFGIAAAALLARILVRHAQWASWYVRRCNNLAEVREIVPRPDEMPKWPKWKELGPIIQSVVVFLSVVALAWLGIFVWLLCLPAAQQDMIE